MTSVCRVPAILAAKDGLSIENLSAHPVEHEWPRRRESPVPGGSWGVTYPPGVICGLPIPRDCSPKRRGGLPNRGSRYNAKPYRRPSGEGHVR